MKRKLLAILLAAAMLMLTACQLAQPDAGEAQTPQEDRIVGVFLTTEPLELFDLEGYLQDNWSGEDLTVSGDTEQYEGRIYARLVEETTYDEDGEAYTYKRYVFDGLEGILLADFCMTAEDGSSYWSSDASEGMNEIHSRLNTTDTGSEVYIEGTVYVSDTADYVIFYYNPIYQTADGAVYLVEGWGDAFNPSSGVTMTHTTTGTLTVTDGDETRTENSTVLVRVETVAVVSAVTAVQLDGEHRVLDTAALTPDSMPQELTLAQDCAYVLLEKQLPDGTVQRELYQPDDRALTVYTDRGDGICIPTGTTLLWPN